MKLNWLLLFKRKNADNLLFLDYDGVLICPDEEIEDYVKRLERLCKKYNLKVVISSSWREYYPECLKMLYDGGFSGKVIGHTSLEGYDRNKQILSFIIKHHFNKLLILDDMPLWLFKKYHVQTDFRKGFDDEAYLKACEILDKQK